MEELTITERLKAAADRFLKWAYNEPFSGPPVISIPRHPDNIDALLLEASAALLSSAEVREEAERERDELRLAITGGEDAPGHNASLSHETILGVLAENYRSWRAASDRWVAAETRAQEAERRADTTSKLGRFLIECADLQRQAAETRALQLEKALREINRCASPDGSRTMDDMIRALDWIAAHARQGEGQ